MTRSSEKGKKAPGSVKKLSMKKETVKDLAVGSGKAKALDDDKLDAVNGGHQKLPASAAFVCQVQRTGQMSPDCMPTRGKCTSPAGGC